MKARDVALTPRERQLLAVLSERPHALGELGELAEELPGLKRQGLARRPWYSRAWRLTRRGRLVVEAWGGGEG